MDYDGLYAHSYHTLLPPDKYFKSHPEFFSMIDGKRTPQQLCETNPHVIHIITEKILRTIKEHPETEILSISPNDGGGHCTCPRCQKLIAKNGSPAASVIFMLNRVGTAIEKDHPDVLLSTEAYLDTIDPPTAIRPRKNVAIRLCNDLHAWRYPFTCFADDNHRRARATGTPSSAGRRFATSCTSGTTL